MAQPAPAARCFVALLPDAAARRRLDALARRLHSRHPGARRVPAANLHLTLAFIGALPATRAQEVSDSLATLAAPHGVWTVDRICGFARARVVWAGGEADPCLLALAQAVRDRLQGLGVSFDRAEFAAHVTLLRGIGAWPQEALARAIPWPLSPPVLMVSTRAAGGRLRYRPWPARPAN
jgi:2'-5' RNA ligase